MRQRLRRCAITARQQNWRVAQLCTVRSGSHTRTDAHRYIPGARGRARARQLAHRCKRAPSMTSAARMNTAAMRWRVNAAMVVTRAAHGGCAPRFATSEREVV